MYIERKNLEYNGKNDAQMDTEIMNENTWKWCTGSPEKHEIGAGGKMVPLSVLPHEKVSRGPKWRVRARPDGPFL